jgi:hypothetical protein
MKLDHIAYRHTYGKQIRPVMQLEMFLQTWLIVVKDPRLKKHETGANKRPKECVIETNSRLGHAERHPVSKTASIGTVRSVRPEVGLLEVRRLKCSIRLHEQLKI